MMTGCQEKGHYIGMALVTSVGTVWTVGTIGHSFGNGMSTSLSMVTLEMTHGAGCGCGGGLQAKATESDK